MSPSTPFASRILSIVGRNWPTFLTLKPSDVGVSGDADVILFLQAVQNLCDEGLLSYEALVVDELGVRILEAGLTTRGRRLVVAVAQDAAGSL